MATRLKRCVPAVEDADGASVDLGRVGERSIRRGYGSVGCVVMVVGIMGLFSKITTAISDRGGTAGSNGITASWRSGSVLDNLLLIPIEWESSKSTGVASSLATPTSAIETRLCRLIVMVDSVDW